MNIHANKNNKIFVEHFLLKYNFEINVNDIINSYIYDIDDSRILIIVTN